MKILAIESSCDDTGISIIVDGLVKSNIVTNQEVHEQYGGVIPELASRQHHINLIPTIESSLNEAKIEMKDLDAIAYTKGPGLLGCLMVGVTFARSLAMSLNIPTIAVNHMHGHIMAHFIEGDKPEFPFLCLTVSGGHTQIVMVNDVDDMHILGETIDDAAGEAFDKVGKMLNLPYPAGPYIDKYAKLGKPIYNFSKARIEGLNFSFSGFKTSVLYFLQNQMKKDQNFIQDNLHDICSSAQHTIVDTLIAKMEMAINSHEIKGIALAGGVSANSLLRSKFEELGLSHQLPVFIPSFEYCTDNAAMIAITAHYKYKKGLFAPLNDMPEPRMKF